MRVAREGKPGPVLVDPPFDIQNSEIEFDIESYRPETFSSPEAEASDTRKALDMIGRVKKQFCSWVPA
jgi:tartronate-semialdehyde synthase